MFKNPDRVVFVGLAKHGGMTARKFETFKAGLRQRDDAEISSQLDARLKAGKSEIISSFTNSADGARRRAAVLNFGMIAIAKAELVPDTTWLGVARAELERDTDPSAVETLHRTIFFTGGSRELLRSVTASIEPDGAYDVRAFVTGVAFGEIVSRDIYSD